MPRRFSFKRSVRAFFKGISGFFQGFGGSGGHGLRLLLPGSHYDYEAQAGDLWRNSAIAIILGWIRTNFPEAILYNGRRDSKGNLIPVKDQRVAQLIKFVAAETPGFSPGEEPRPSLDCGANRS